MANAGIAIAVSIYIGTNVHWVGLTCWSANKAAQQRRPTDPMYPCCFDSP